MGTARLDGTRHDTRYPLVTIDLSKMMDLGMNARFIHNGLRDSWPLT